MIEPSSVTGTWGVSYLSNKVESTPGNFARIKEAEITANRCGFVKKPITSEADKPCTTYKLQYSDAQLNDTRVNEGKNQYARFQKLKVQDKTNLQYTGDYSRKLMVDSELMTETYNEVERAKEEAGPIGINPETIQEYKLASPTSKSKKVRMHTHDAPVATGSSNRAEKGKSVSGLCGEVFNNSDNMTTNSFMQRSWMGRVDPALNIKMNGRPTVEIPNDLSLAVGDPDNIGGSSIDPDIRYYRKPVLTGDPMSKFGSRRAGVFADEKEVIVEQNIRR